MIPSSRVCTVAWRAGFSEDSDGSTDSSIDISYPKHSSTLFSSSFPLYSAASLSLKFSYLVI